MAFGKCDNCEQSAKSVKGKAIREKVYYSPVFSFLRTFNACLWAWSWQITSSHNRPGRSFGRFRLYMAMR